MFDERNQHTPRLAEAHSAPVQRSSPAPNTAPTTGLRLYGSESDEVPGWSLALVALLVIAVVCAMSMVFLRIEIL
jgi:hypothetical protein